MFNIQRATFGSSHSTRSLFTKSIQISSLIWQKYTKVTFALTLKKILQIDEIEYTNTSFAFNFCIQISLLFWSLVYTNFTSVLNSKIRKNCIQIDPLTCRQISPLSRGEKRGYKFVYTSVSICLLNLWGNLNTKRLNQCRKLSTIFHKFSWFF